jgi:hypothetical protein
MCRDWYRRGKGGNPPSRNPWTTNNANKIPKLISISPQTLANYSSTMQLMTNLLNNILNTLSTSVLNFFHGTIFSLIASNLLFHEKYFHEIELGSFYGNRPLTSSSVRVRWKVPADCIYTRLRDDYYLHQSVPVFVAIMCTSPGDVSLETLWIPMLQLLLWPQAALLKHCGSLCCSCCCDFKQH